MPFDVLTGVDADPAQWHRFTMETAGSEFVPDIQHITDDMVLLMDSSLLAMIQVPGYPFELEGMHTRNIRRRQLNDLFRSIADDNVTLGMHLVHHEHILPFSLGNFRSRTAQGIINRYMENCIDGKLIANDWFISVVVSPRSSLMKKMRRHIPWLRGSMANPANAVPRQMATIMQNLMAYLGSDGGRRLGIRHDEFGHPCSEIAEARRLMLMGRWQAIPLTTGTLGAAIYTDRVTCGTRLVRIDHLDGPRFAKTVALRDYPGGEKNEDGKITGGTYTGQFSHFTHLPETFPFVIAQTFRFQSRGASDTRLYMKTSRMENLFSVETRGRKAMTEAREDVLSGEVVRGHHNFGITVFGATPADVHRAAGVVGTAMINAGTVPIAEDGGSFSAYWSGLPGQPEWLEGRSGSISSRNLTAFITLEGFPAGDTTGYWGKPLIRFRTSGNTAYDWVPHANGSDVGHAIFLGRSTSGKTLLMSLLVCALEQAGSTVIFFDKDNGAEPVIRATGGAYFNLRVGEDSGMVPLRGLTNTPGNRSFLETLLTAAIVSDGRGPLKVKTAELLRRAITRQMRLPAAERSLGAVRAFLGFGEEYDGERMDKWCKGGAMGWLFDGERDEIELTARLIGFNMTQLLQHATAPLVGAYLIHRVTDLIDGQRKITVICDECKFYLLSPLFAQMIIDFALTLRKKNGMLWLAAQDPEHIIESPSGASIASQAQTIWAFPSRSANPHYFIDKLGFTVPMFRALTEQMPVLPYRSVMLKRDNGSAILHTELTDMEDEIRILSGREENARLIPGILAGTGNDADAFTEAFVKQTRRSS